MTRVKGEDIGQWRHSVFRLQLFCYFFRRSMAIKFEAFIAVSKSGSDAGRRG